jgi:hypothetical protein
MEPGLSAVLYQPLKLSTYVIASPDLFGGSSGQSDEALCGFGLPGRAGQ